MTDGLRTGACSRVWLEFTSDGDPRAKGRPRLARGRRAYTPAVTRRAEETVAWDARAAMVGMSPITSPIRVELAFFTRTARRVDVDNLAKLALDALNGIVWRDDSQIVHLTVSRTIDRVRPRTEIRVWRASAGAEAA